MSDAQGNLYGTAYQGGKFGGGTVYRLRADAKGQWKLEVLHDFCHEDACIDGLNPQSAVIVDAEGNLYGVTTADIGSEGRDGLVYRLHPDGQGWKYDILYRFCQAGVCDGMFPIAGLSYAGQSTGAVYDGKSPLYGVVNGGGANDAGLVYELDPNGGQWQHTDLYSFCAQAQCADGSIPQSLIVVDADHLVGVVAEGGASGSGLIFRLINDGTMWNESVFHEFCIAGRCKEGAGSSSSLAMDAAGNFYGTTPSGGYCNGQFVCGVLFRIAPDGTETVLFDFCKQVGGCRVGSDPGAGVTLGADGTIYGTTLAGGLPGNGVIWAFDGTSMKRLHSFCDQGCEFGGNVRSQMIIDPKGRLYGVTPEGDIGGGGGVVFSLDP